MTYTYIRWKSLWDGHFRLSERVSVLIHVTAIENLKKLTHFELLRLATKNISYLAMLRATHRATTSNLTSLALRSTFCSSPYKQNNKYWGEAKTTRSSSWSCVYVIDYTERDVIDKFSLLKKLLFLKGRIIVSRRCYTSCLLMILTERIIFTVHDSIK